MAKLRIRRGDKVLGSTDPDGLREWLESGLISEYDLVAVGDGEEWQLIRDFMESGGAAADTEAATETVSDPDDFAPIDPTPAPTPAPAAEAADDSYRPIWDVEEEEEEDEEAAEIRMPQRPPSSAEIPATPEPPRRKKRSSGSVPVPPSDSQEVLPTEALEEDEIEAAFRKLVRWESEAPTVADPAAKSDPRAAARKSAQRSGESNASGAQRRGKKKRRREGPPSDPEQPRRRQKRRS